MFGFINDYIKKFDLSNKDFKLVFIDGSFLCVQGFKNLLKITDEEIALKTQNGEILIIGENLQIKEFCSGEILISGNIFKIER